ncbi:MULTISPECIES: STAS domain-containing protein [unclassified Amycolatopsis]|uniref:STAS domain-containing protein n=1 Tax=unclassified Amycolatopsis TaxID=2618356 RepID=UPI002E0E2D3F|nr:MULTISPECIES: STAS domain-containing protein [unclassified Amycolatopsis]WSK77392.1 STAS domain-containing protein [Amycolatopsis sp. NBC_01286]
METPRPDGTGPANDLLTVTRQSAGDGDVSVRARGEVDASTSPVLEDALTAELAGGPRRLTLDLDSVTFFSSAGISTLVTVQGRCADRGTRFVVLAPRRVRRVIGLAGIDRVVTVLDSGAPGPGGT